MANSEEFHWIQKIHAEICKAVPVNTNHEIPTKGCTTLPRFAERRNGESCWRRLLKLGLITLGLTALEGFWNNLKELVK